MHVMCAVESYPISCVFLSSQAFSCQMECHVKQMEYVRMYAIDHSVYVINLEDAARDKGAQGTLRGKSFGFRRIKDCESKKLHILL